jgi:hypothetical protein
LARPSVRHDRHCDADKRFAMSDAGKNSDESKHADLAKVHSAPWYHRYGCRSVLVLMGFLGCANTYSMRVNMSLAIVAMVNHTAIGEHKNNSNECPLPVASNVSSSKIDGKTSFLIHFLSPLHSSARLFSGLS